MWIFISGSLFFLAPSSPTVSFFLSLLHPSLIPFAHLLEHLILLSVCLFHFGFHQFCLLLFLSILPLIDSFGLFSVRLLGLRPLCQPPLPLPPPPHSTLFFPPMFPFTDSQHSLPLSSALSPHYKDSHWQTCTFQATFGRSLISSCSPCEEQTN